MTEQYTPSWFDVRDEAQHVTPWTGEELDRMIEAVRAEAKREFARDLLSRAPSFNEPMGAERADRESSACDIHATRLQALGVDQQTLDALEMLAQVGMPPERIRDTARAFARGETNERQSDD